MLIVAALYTAADEDLDFLAAYAESGGHLVLGPRSAYADPEARPREERQPAGLSKPAGVGYDELANLDAAVEVESDDLTGAATLVAELLEPDGADVLARYVHPHLGRWAAVTTKTAGAGRITVVGTVPDQELAESLARWLVPEPAAGWQLPALRDGLDLGRTRWPAARAAQLGLGPADGLCPRSAPRPPHRRGRSTPARRCSSVPGTSASFTQSTH